MLKTQPLASTNVSYLWASVIVQTLHQLGLAHVVICPGSRSVPLTFAFAMHSGIHCTSILDERSAAFFALGLGQRTGKPVALVCTSGTAAANMYPAVIEARMNHVPLIVLTTDRPPEARGCHTRQTIDQVHLFGQYPHLFQDLAVPELRFDVLKFLRQTVVRAYEKTVQPAPGPVHLNIPFREPLDPSEDPATRAFVEAHNWDAFFGAVQAPIISTPELQSLPKGFFEEPQGIIVVGTLRSECPLTVAKALGTIARITGWPVLADPFSPLRHHASHIPQLITHYDAILQNADWAHALRPRACLQIGKLPLGRAFLKWFSACQFQHCVLDPYFDHLNAWHHSSIALRTTVQRLAERLSELPIASNTPYAAQWLGHNSRIHDSLDAQLRPMNALFEGKLPWLLSQYLPRDTCIFTAISMPIRDAESYWLPSDHGYQLYSNKGTNGIDGTVSSALGVAHAGTPSVVVTGDLSFIYDANSLLVHRQIKGSLTIIIVNNNGGSIFDLLPIAQHIHYLDTFERFIKTPQCVSIQMLAKAHDIPYFAPTSWDAFLPLVQHLPAQGVRIIELQTQSAHDHHLRHSLHAAR